MLIFCHLFLFFAFDSQLTVVFTNCLYCKYIYNYETFFHYDYVTGVFKKETPPEELKL